MYYCLGNIIVAFTIFSFENGTNRKSRLTIRPGLAGTVPVLRPCPGVPAVLSNCPGFLYRIEDQLIIGKETWAAGVKTFF